MLRQRGTEKSERKKIYANQMQYDWGTRVQFFSQSPLYETTAIANDGFVQLSE